MMRDRGHQVMRYRVRRLMKELGLICKQLSFHAYKTATVERLDIPNQLNRARYACSPAGQLRTQRPVGTACSGSDLINSALAKRKIFLIGECFKRRLYIGSTIIYCNTTIKVGYVTLW